MRKIKLYIATSLNGQIARSDGGVDWLESIPNPEKLDYGYKEFYDSIDSTIQGYSTYRQIMSWGIDFPYAGKKNYVFTRQQGISDTEFVEFVTEDHIEFVKQLKQQKGKDIWLIGGGQINTLLFNEGLIDEVLVFVMPIVIPKGIQLFEAVPKETQLKLVSTKSHTTGVVEMNYSPV